jgi:uncharacterized repeat protein (TIGR01451 family)
MEFVRPPARLKSAARFTAAPWQFRCQAWWPLLVAFCAIIHSGCASFNIPAIDPTGQQLFLSQPNSTTLAAPENCTLFPSPAFQTPPTPPPCVQGFGPGCGGPSTSSCYDPHCNKFKDQGERGQIMMTPLRVVAPVGGEVVLLAGICGEDGYLVTREPLEWMLSPDSVGQFVEVGDDAKGKLISHDLSDSFHGKTSTEKLGIDFARGKTSSRESMITRGSPSKNDDLIVRRGQTWISLTSPTPGTSYITALAPDSKVWDRRRVTAKVHWVQGQWQFPSPQNRADRESALLTTLVTVSEGVPAPNWKVVYRSLQPQVALFANGSDTVEVRTNADGNATAELVQNNGAIGTAIVGIEVLTPADSQMNTPEMILGRGQTSVSWVAPRLSLFADGPPEAGIGQTLLYNFRILNSGQLPATAAQARLTLPSGMKFLDASLQPANFTPSGASWDFGTLQPGQEIIVSARCQAESESAYRVQFETRAEPNLYQVQSVSTNVFRPALDVTIRPTENRRETQVGETILMEIDVRNISNRPLTDVRVLVEADPGMVEVNRRENSVLQTIPILAGGEVKPIGINFLVQQPGTLRAKVSVSAPQNAFASAETSIMGVAQPASGEQLQGGVYRNVASSVVQGEDVVFSLQLTNTGPPLTGIRIFCDPDMSLQPKSIGGDGYDQQATTSTQRMTWILDRWETGQQRVFAGRFVAAQGGRTSRVRFTVTSLEGLSANYDGVVDVTQSLGDATSPRTPSSDPAGGDMTTPAEGSLTLQLIESGDPVKVNAESSYRLILKNNTTQEDNAIDIQLSLPAGVDFVSIGSNLQQLRITNRTADGIIRLETINSLRGAETLTLSLRVLPRQPMTMQIKAFTRSLRQPNGVETSVETTVIP